MGWVASTEFAGSFKAGVVYWFKDDGVATGIARSLASLGHHAVELRHDDRLPDGLDLIIAHGPLHSLVPLANQLIALPPTSRPAFALILTEQLPNPAIPEWVRFRLGKLRSWLERTAYREAAPGEWRAPDFLIPFLDRFYRYRYYGDLFWLRDEGVLTVLALWSDWSAGYLRARGFDPLVLSGGFEQNWGGDLRLERDIPVLWLGKVGSARRARLLKRLRVELRQRGVEMMVVDGIEHPYVYGEARTVLLNRTRIVLNLLRQKWDDNSMRFVLAARNGALVVTEPTLPHTRHQPGVDLVVSPPGQMADTICYYLAHEEERLAIAENASRLAAGHSKPSQAISDILEKAKNGRRHES
jgi:hypothetical protein